VAAKGPLTKLKCLEVATQIATKMGRRLKRLKQYDGNWVTFHHTTQKRLSLVVATLGNFDWRYLVMTSDSVNPSSWTQSSCDRQQVCYEIL